MGRTDSHAPDVFSWDPLGRPPDERTMHWRREETRLSALLPVIPALYCGQTTHRPAIKPYFFIEARWC